MGRFVGRARVRCISFGMGRNVECPENGIIRGRDHKGKV